MKVVREFFWLIGRARAARRMLAAQTYDAGEPLSPGAAQAPRRSAARSARPLRTRRETSRSDA